MYITINDVKVKIKLLKSSGKILAQATVILFDVWEEHGWKILTSNKIHPVFQESIWIQAPSFKLKNKEGKLDWRETVYIADPKLYSSVEEKIYDSYCLVRNRRKGQESTE